MTSQARDADRRGNPGNEDEGGEGDGVDGGRNGLGDNDGVGERVGEAGDRREGGDGGRAPLGGGDDDGGGRRNQAREGIEVDEDRNENLKRNNRIYARHPVPNQNQNTDHQKGPFNRQLYANSPRSHQVQSRVANAAVMGRA